MLEMEGDCFENGELCMKGFPALCSSKELPKLNTFKCGENNFKKTQQLQFNRITLPFFSFVFPSLVNFSCEAYSFRDTKLALSSGLELLESLRFGDCSFYRSNTLYLANLKKLSLISFGRKSFHEVKAIHFISFFKWSFSEIFPNWNPLCSCSRVRITLRF